MSIFKRTKPAVPESLQFSGHPHLDREISLHVGDFVLLQSDSPTTHALRLLKYFLSCQKELLICQRSLGMTKGVAQQVKIQQTNKEKNTIAWRYNSQSKKDQSSSKINILKSAGLVKELILKGDGPSIYRQIIKTLEQMSKYSDDTRPTKLAFIVGDSFNLDKNFYSAFKKFVRSNYIVALIIVQPQYKQIQFLRKSSDKILAVGEAGKGFEHFAACLTIKKNCTVGLHEWRAVKQMGIRSEGKGLFIEEIYQNAEQSANTQIDCGILKF